VGLDQPRYQCLCTTKATNRHYWRGFLRHRRSVYRCQLNHRDTEAQRNAPRRADIARPSTATKSLSGHGGLCASVPLWFNATVKSLKRLAGVSPHLLKG
jgi:hypothetical protein